MSRTAEEIAKDPSDVAKPVEQAAVGGRSLWDDARRRLFRNRAAVTSMWILAVLVAFAFIGPLVWVHDYQTIYTDRVKIAPTFENLHLLGTDQQGRDLMARLMIGLRISMVVGVVATVVSLVIGVTWGATAGFVGGRVDNLMMRIVDVLYAMPFIFFVILLLTIFERNIFLIFAAIGAIEWLTMARIVRGQTLTLKNKEFIEAARAAGVSQAAIIRRHILPNVIGPVAVYVTLTIPVVILAESFLSFLGLGVNEPLTSLGVLISDGAREMQERPWMLLAPAVAMALTLLCLNFIGDGLRDALDPKER
ncbi:MAG: ABC transporter permease subunit [Pseudomonadota bacterium]